MRYLSMILAAVLVLCVAAAWAEGNTAEVITFETENMEGQPVGLADFADSKVIMLNFWEPWCGPCVSEMPSLQRLYEEYRDQGFTVVGIFSAEGMDDDVRAVLANAGVDYPILRFCWDMLTLQTGYVPTTYFVDGQGRLLISEPIIEAKKYDEWKQVIELCLKAVSE